MHLHLPMESRQLYSILDRAGDAAFAAGPFGRICYWSPAAEQLLGYSKQQALGKDCWDVLAGIEDDRKKICCRGCRIFEWARRRKQVPAFDLHAATAGGERKWLNVSILVAPVGEGPSPLVVHLMRDIGPRKRLEAAAKQFLGCAFECGAAQGPDQKGRAVRAEYNLSARETAVLRLLSQGRSTQQIAAQLGISPVTVRNHVQRVLSKLDSHTRLEAVLQGIQAGLI